ncbi:aminomethyl-transferring glycine dehydrogenase [soil metagenome]
MTRENPLPSLRDLEAQDAFIARHIGPDEADRRAMLETIGVADIGALVEAIVPASIRLDADSLALLPAVGELEAIARLRALASKNRVLKNFIGMGYHGTQTPPVILRNILENPAWYTAYTPYQAEISQGRMEALINFQTMVCDLTGMQISNASLLDEGTAASEAMTLALRTTRSKSKRFFVSDQCHPQTIEVLVTRAEAIGIEVEVGPDEAIATTDAFGVLLQYPASKGMVTDPAARVAAARARGTVITVATDLLALALLVPPGEWGADIVVGSTQRFGVPLGYGGPHAAFLACKDAFKRSMPGRLIGVSVDSQGQPAYRLTLQTREQHIRREKATSNICTAQVLLAVMASMYAVYHGPSGIRRIAERTHRFAALFATGLARAGKTVPAQFFDTVLVSGVDAPLVHAKARAAGRNLRETGLATDEVAVSFDETTTRADLAALFGVFGVEADIDVLDHDAGLARFIPASLRRDSAYLEHPVFNTHHSETEMLRYMRGLADKDLALDRAMIPLGSCTMKLNATSEMLPVTWPEFSSLHPYAPADQAVGYREMIEQLEAMLAECTGYDSVSLQPNSGAQGEYAGLLAIRAYHRSRGEAHRRICLIPESAHGTNPASAQMCGMDVVVVKCDEAGNVDIADLRRRAGEHADDLAALMITYPSTHGVFEEAVVEICEIVHAAGGQVYTDGATMNALVGVAKPGRYGSDVSHLNLHKTFCIPHGGGGPGVGPVAVKSHLAPFLPGHGAVGPVSAAPFGSASILPISWMYVTMMGRTGLRQATEAALLNANYIARRLAAHYPVLYTGSQGHVAHECILDLRPIKESSGISAEDVAKRLIDYGFHAPTLSFPVAGTLMVEPNESESKAELDRFLDAMVAIRQEIRAVEEGRLDRDDNPLRNAPHTAATVMAEQWLHAYTREQAAFPVAELRLRKYWPPVGRVDNAYGDRNVMCSCIPIEAYSSESSLTADVD